MSGTTLSGLYLAPVTLTNGATENPATILSSATLTPGSGAALLGKSGTAWNVDNAGTIVAVTTLTSTTLSGIGISLQSGGTISNAAGGIISGGGGPLVYSGTYNDGIRVSGGSGRIVNDGTIEGAAGIGIRLFAGGDITNNATGRITGGGYGVRVQSGAATVTNAGSIAGKSSGGIALLAGGTVSNASGGTVRGGSLGVFVGKSGTITNAGSIDANTGSGIWVQPDMRVTNAATGTISGKDQGIFVLYNFGAYSGTVQVTNAGLVTAQDFSGVAILAAGTVTNQAGGTVSGSNFGIYILNDGTVVNSGTVQARASYSSAGVYLHSGGSVLNAASAVISGHDGVLFANAGGTVDTSGTISSIGTGGVAIQVVASQTNRVILHPGAAFNGVVDGGSSVASTLELATGTGVGVLSGLGTEYINFGNVIVDAGANWQFAALTSLDIGSIVVNGTAQFLTSQLTVTAGSLVVDSGADLSLGGTVVFASGSTLDYGGQATVVAGTLEAGAVWAGAGTLAVDVVAMASGAQWTNSGTIVVQPGTVAISDGGFTNQGTIRLQGSSIWQQDGAVSLSVGGLWIVDGDLRFTAPQLTVTSGTLSIDSGATFEIAGQSTFETGSTLTYDGGVVVSDGSIASGATWAGKGTIDVGSGTIQSGGVWVNDGSVIVEPGTVTFNDGTFTNNGSVTIHGGALWMQSGSVSIDAGGVWIVDGSLVVNAPTLTVGSGTLDINSGGSFEIASDSTFSSGSTLTYDGSVAIVDGTLDAGARWSGSGTLIALGETLTSGAVWSNAGVVSVADGLFQSGATWTNSGTIEITGGAFVAAGSVGFCDGTLVVDSLQGSGHVVIGGGLLLDATGSLSVGQSVVVHSGGTVEIDSPTLFLGTLAFVDMIGTLVLPDTMTLVNASIIDGSTLELEPSIGAPIDFKIDPSQSLTSANLVFTGNVVTISCFRLGTPIATPRGEIWVEDLRVGDEVVTISGDLPHPRRIRWIGHRAIDCTGHPRPEQVWPVRVRPGALGEETPNRDVWLSPDHAVLVDDVLIPIKLLVNGDSIAIDPTDRVVYYHLELEEHAILLAGGLPAESYLDTGDRSNFANGGPDITLHPDFAARVWDGAGCAPLYVTGPVVERARRHVRVLAEGRIMAA